jgi:hypothetical protein
VGFLFGNAVSVFSRLLQNICKGIMHLFTRKSHAASYLRSFNRQAVRVEAEVVGATSLPAIMDGGVARQFEASGGEQSPAFRAELVNGQGVTSLTATSPLASTNHSRLHERDSAEIAAVPPPQWLAYDEGIAASKFEASGVRLAHGPTTHAPARQASKRVILNGSRCVATSVELPVPLASSISPAGGKPTDAPSVMPPALISEAMDHKMVSNLDGEKPTGVQGCYQSAGSVASA